ncbi:oleate hydratase [Aspergillus niger CBS 101883]|uniref:67 kDa myosin-cross-reactive antigen family protein n=1 Tax=Aspergillus niger ATCC 13496 TaxID=1353008 RepID=A0A370CD33_ASPNG|nr:uncharacterized protein BO96DRAFT_344056 [Aspergillus niger CBS 101883]PYH54061.1 hypothetical protein BO96DRAFT_344056 [Aspergillus niger CBS 101883]RDH25597.1 hypothetical protein M747DRAFT_227008 [Aspergillus niger ATCC 13496]
MPLASDAFQADLSRLSPSHLEVSLPVTLSLAVLAYLLLVSTLRFQRVRILYRDYPQYTTRASMSQMTVDDAWAIQKNILQLEFPTTAVKALQFALFRTYGIPTISSLLLHTSQFSNPATSFKRYADTGALIGQFVTCPPTSSRARTAIARTKFLHSGYRASGRILESDMLYTLSLFATEPIRFVERFEWRAMTELERCAIGTYWKSLGDALDISYDELPSGKSGFSDGLHFLEELRQWGDHYEEENMRPDHRNRLVADKTMDVIVYGFPKWVRGVGVRFATCVMDNRLREAMMYDAPPVRYRRIFTGLVALRKYFLRYLHLPRPMILRQEVFSDTPNEDGRYYVQIWKGMPYYVQPTMWNRWGPAAWLTWALGLPLPGDDGDTYYPRGFDVADLGPRQFEGRGRKSVGEYVDVLEKEHKGQCPFGGRTWRRLPEGMDAWILGAGISSLTAAVHLIQEAHVPPSRVHILETLSQAGGGSISTGDPVNGYDCRAGGMPPFNDVCMEELLSLVPSKTNPNLTVLEEFHEFWDTEAVKDHPHTRFLTRHKHGLERIDAKRASLGLRDRVDLFMLASNAAEFRRYLQHYMHDIHEIHCRRKLDGGRYNRHESIVSPIAHFLCSRGVDFRFHTTVTDIITTPSSSEPHRVSAIKAIHENEPEMTINLGERDIVLVSLGSVMSGSTTGTNTSPPSLELMDIEKDLDENWLLWLELSTKNPIFGNAYNFCTRMAESRLESFTVTFSSPEFFNRFTALTGDKVGSGTFVTLKDTPWLLSINLPQQPLFPDQPAHVQVLWGYAMYPEREGDYIKKPMLEYHSITLPCVVPRAAATLLVRLRSDRPPVIPPGIDNLGLIGQFVDIPGEVAVTMDYGVRSAQTAVRQLMGLERHKVLSKRSSAINLKAL